MMKKGERAKDLTKNSLYRLFFVDKLYRVPRIWSNCELRKVAGLFRGSVINVSAWKDEDKEGNVYKEYFTKADSYTITNFDSDKRGMQGKINEIYLDLEKELPAEMRGKYDVVFNHTTLEHVYDFRKAVKNICALSRDIVIIVVPFLQPMHGDYGDYWRFSPLAVKRLLEENGLSMLCLKYNDTRRAAVYVFGVGTKKPKQWSTVFNKESNEANRDYFVSMKDSAGYRAINNNLLFKIIAYLKMKFKKNR